MAPLDTTCVARVVVVRSWTVQVAPLPTCICTRISRVRQPYLNGPGDVSSVPAAFSRVDRAPCAPTSAEQLSVLAHPVEGGSSYRGPHAFVAVVAVVVVLLGLPDTPS
jgi:hypothetical protein